MARSTGPARATTRRFCAGVSAEELSTSNTASTRVSDRCACWPPGPLERENRSSISSRGRITERVTRIDSPGMAAILLDVDGVLHVSGRVIPGAPEAVRELREAGHRLRFVTNNTTRPRAALADELRACGIELDDDELQTTAAAAARALAGRRVLALVMAALVADLDAMELVGDGADAVLLGGADETDETGRVFSYMNLARAFGELELGAELYCLHKNRWWQTSRGPLLDSARSSPASSSPPVSRRPCSASRAPPYFEAALEALDAEPELTWMVGDDLDSDVAGAQRYGLKTVLVRTGKFRPDELNRSMVVPDAVISSVAYLPEWLERPL